MKKLATLSVIALLGAAVFSGCSKSSSSSPAYSMNATVGGSKYSAGNCAAVSASGVIFIEGLGGSSSTPTYPLLELFITTGSLTTGTFNFDSTTTTNYAEYFPTSSLTDFKISKSGSVTITSVSPNIVGTFSFTCTDGTAVTNGTFTAKHY